MVLSSSHASLKSTGSSATRLPCRTGDGRDPPCRDHPARPRSDRDRRWPGLGRGSGREGGDGYRVRHGIDRRRRPVRQLPGTERGVFRLGRSVRADDGVGVPGCLVGLGFAPALDAPLFAFRGDCLPADTLAKIVALGVQKVVRLGSAYALSPAVE